MTRTVAREIAVMLIYSLAANPYDGALDDFFETEYYGTLKSEDEVFEQYPDEPQMAYIRRLVSGATECREEVDAYIGKYAKDWKVERISKTALAVLRTAMYEILYMDESDIPDAVAINEAVELSKGYEVQETVAFINGILGSFHKGEVAIGEASDVDPALDSEEAPNTDEASDIEEVTDIGDG